MAVSISKDQVIEFIGKRRDVLVLLVLVMLGAWGYLKLREPLAKTVDDVIEDRVAAPSPGGSMGDASTLNSGDLLSALEFKRPVSMYRHNRSPFGTPAEQMRLRQEVQQLYKLAVDLFTAGKYELAIQQFDRLRRLDVTETRIQYPIPPSEYKRRAECQVKLRNLDSILAKANEDIQRAGGLESSSPSEAIDLYESVLLALRNLLSVDPQGEAMGTELFDRISTQVSQVSQTVVSLKRQTLDQNVDAALTALNAALQRAPSDGYSVMLAVVRGRRLQKEVQEVDAEGTVVAASKRTQLDSLVKTGEETLTNALEDVTQQVRTRTTDAVGQKDFAAAHECMKAFSEICAQYPDNRILSVAQLDVMAMYVGGLIQAGQEQMKTVTEAIQKGDYGSYDPKAKEALLGHLSTAQMLESLLSETDRAQLAQLEDRLRRLEPPPPLNEAYNLVDFRSVGNFYRVKLQEKSSGKESSLSLRLKRKDKSGFLLSQVDNRNRVIILSKVPEYAPSQFKIPPRR